MAERPAAERAPERMGSAVNRAPERSFDSAVDPVKPAKAAEPARAVRPPVELPRAPAPAPIEAVPEAEEHKGTSAVLIVLVVIVLIAAAAFFVWKYVLDQHDAAVETPSATAPVQVAPPPAPAPPPPPAPATKVALETPPANEIKSVRAGAVETVLADKTSVKEGDVVLKFVGYQSIEAERTSLQRDQKRLQDLIDAANKKLAAAQSAGNKAAETASQTELTNRNNQLAAKQMAYTNKSAEFDKFMVYAAHAGTFAPQVKLRQKLAVDAVIGKIEHDPVPVAVFKVADPKPFAPQSSVELAIGKSEQHVSCTVADVQADSIKVGCPANPALTDGADVTLKVPGATSPPSEDAPAPAGAGSTAAPSEAAGSAAAPAAEPPSAGSAN
jgi:hypothetical protein